MHDHRERLESIRDILIFALLVAVGVVGRLGQPDWDFTPVAATAIFAGFYFTRIVVAALVPLAILAVSDQWLAAYNNGAVLLVKYAAMILPVGLGRLLANQPLGWRRLWRWGVCGFVPAATFFLTTNFAVWTFQSDYSKTLSGLAACYAAGIPFFRSMLTGDLVYLSVLFGCWALSEHLLPAARFAGAPPRATTAPLRRPPTQS